MRHSGKYTAAKLRAIPTIGEGHFDNLKIETPTMRVWLSRCGKADGLPYDNGVTEEVYDMASGCWVKVAEYPG